MRTELPTVASSESALLAAPLAAKSMQTRSVARSVAVYVELSKPRILILILLTAMAGFGLASSSINSLLLQIGRAHV